MTNPSPVPPEHDVLPPEAGGALSVPPPVPQKKPGFFRRLFMSRKKQQAVAMQNGYLEMVDLIRAIRSHLDRQESVQTSVLSMLEKVPDAMDRQHEVMTMFKQQLENGMENNRRLTDSMGNLNNTLSAMDESQRASSRTVTDLIHRSRESEQLLREVMRRSERRMTALVVFFFLAIVALGFYFVRGKNPTPAPAAASAVEVAVTPLAAPTKPVPAKIVPTKLAPAKPTVEDKKVGLPMAKNLKPPSPPSPPLKKKKSACPRLRNPKSPSRRNSSKKKRRFPQKRKSLEKNQKPSRLRQNPFPPYPSPTGQPSANPT